jgi:hypothetical protein
MFLNGVPLLDALALGARRKHSFICWDANIQISVLALCYSAARSFVATSKSFSQLQSFGSVIAEGIKICRPLFARCNFQRALKKTDWQ